MIYLQKICYSILYLQYRGDILEKKIAIALGIVAGVLLLNIVTKGAAWPFIIIGTLGYFVYKNNR